MAAGHDDNGLHILVVARARSSGVSPFVEEQVRSLRELGVNADIQPLRGRSISAYAGLMWRLRKLPQGRRPHLVHAHFGLTGFAATFQSDVPVVVTYHGSDINNPQVCRLSRRAANRAAANIVVSQRLALVARFERPPEVIPCGIDLETFYPEDHAKARYELGFGDEKVVVFPASRGRWVKNFELAERAVSELPMQARLVELSGFTRDGVRKVLSAADVLLMTSRSEGSPQVIKEALATGCPIVSTDVGDVQATISGLPNCFIATSSASDIAGKLTAVLQSGARIEPPAFLGQMSMRAVAERVLAVYHGVVGR